MHYLARVLAIHRRARAGVKKRVFFATINIVARPRNNESLRLFDQFEPSRFNSIHHLTGHCFIRCPVAVFRGVKVCVGLSVALIIRNLIWHIKLPYIPYSCSFSMNSCRKKLNLSFKRRNVLITIQVTRVRAQIGYTLLQALDLNPNLKAKDAHLSRAPFQPINETHFYSELNLLEKTPTRKLYLRDHFQPINGAHFHMSCKWYLGQMCVRCTDIYIL